MADTQQTTQQQPTLNTLWGGFTEDAPVQEVKPAAVDITQAAAQQQQQTTPSQQQQLNQEQQQPQPAAKETPEEGKDKDKEQKPDEKATEDPNGEGEPGEDGEYEPMDFWNDVDALRGRPLKVDLSTFEDPTSPEAYMAVEKAVRQEAMRDYDAHVEETDPRAYAYFLHRRNGGTDEEFFSQASDQLPDYEQFKGNVDLQKKVYTSALKARGVSDKVIALSIAEAEKDNTLFEAADKEYQDRKNLDSQQLDNIKRENDARNAEYQTAVNAIENKIDDVIFKGKTTRLQIPETKKNDFAGFLKGKLTYDEGTNRFFLGTAITPDNINDVVEALYFQFSGGDIQKLATAAARTLNAKRLGANVNKAKAQGEASHNKDDNKPSGMIPITELF